MISRGYCLMMARYNAWQNSQLSRVVNALPAAELTRDRQAFFGSILGTLSHLLWGDLMWMARFDGGPAPTCGIAASSGHSPTLAAWQDERTRTDDRIGLWAEQIGDSVLGCDLTWFSGSAGTEITRPMALCVTHFFNHQTHHRGQIHAMLTGAGAVPPVSDLFLMPEE